MIRRLRRMGPAARDRDSAKRWLEEHPVADTALTAAIVWLAFIVFAAVTGILG